MNRILLGMGKLFIFVFKKDMLMWLGDRQKHLTTRTFGPQKPPLIIAETATFST
jgi:hypothetical protein